MCTSLKGEHMIAENKSETGLQAFFFSFFFIHLITMFICWNNMAVEFV